MRGLRDSETIPGKCRVAVLIDGIIHVAVISIMERYVPICAIEPNAVRQDLKRSCWAAIRLAICCSNMVVAGYSGVLRKSSSA